MSGRPQQRVWQFEGVTVSGHPWSIDIERAWRISIEWGLAKREGGFVMFAGLEGGLYLFNPSNVGQFSFNERLRCKLPELRSMIKKARWTQTGDAQVQVHLTNGEHLTYPVRAGEQLDRFAAEMPERAAQELSLATDGAQRVTIDARRVEYIRIPLWLLSRRFNRYRFKFLIAEAQREAA